MIFFLVMREFLGFNNFKIYHTAVLTVNIVHHTPSTYLFYNQKFVFSDHLYPFSHSPNYHSGKHKSDLLFFEFGVLFCFQILCISDIIQSLSFCLIYLTQHNALKFYPWCHKWQIFFFFFYSSLIFNCVYYHNLFIHISIDRQFKLFPCLDIVHNAEVNIGVHIFLQHSVFVFFGYIPWSGIARSYGSSSFNFLRNVHIVFHSGCTNLQSYQQCTRISFSSHRIQHLLALVFLKIAILPGVR